MSGDETTSLSLNLVCTYKIRFAGMKKAKDQNVIAKRRSSQVVSKQIEKKHFPVGSRVLPNIASTHT